MLIREDQKLLMRIIFLLRIACKEIDEDFIYLLGFQKSDDFALKTLFTKPKGHGWNCTIDFIHRHKNDFGLKNINIILPLLDDWNNKNKVGDTTKQASQIALNYYDELTKDRVLWYGERDGQKEQLIRVILQGASEIATELKTIFNEIITKKQISHRDKYYAVVQTILTSLTDSSEIVKCLPTYVLSLADLFWFQPPSGQGEYDLHPIGVEQYFGLSEKHDFDYFPSSALQTPIYPLLRVAPKETAAFILSFTNKAVECYAQSKLNDEIEEVKVFVDEAKPIKQYISDRLWNMHRGTQVSTCLLESMHMALEKWLLENAGHASKEILESWCLYLLRNSKSASITAIVASVVLAQPSKLFNIAKILFKTKQLFLYETHRLVIDESAKSLYGMGFGLNYRNELFQNERIKTCDEEHRKKSLEHLALQYQLFRTEGESEEEAKERQEALWEIFDKYYAELPDKSVETDFDKTWRLYLSRMDRRKMNIGVERKDKKVLINFNPEIDQELKKYSEDALSKSSAAIKYLPLRLWSNCRLKKEESKYVQYQQYENNPQLVIKETKEIIEGQKHDGEESLPLDWSIPAYACSVLVRDFIDKLSKEDKEFCKEVLIGFASMPLRAKLYHYQISDGTEPAIIILPELIKLFPEDGGKIKFLLLLLLTQWGEVESFATRSILNSLWDHCCPR
jgi:hypothetical protein